MESDHQTIKWVAGVRVMDCRPTQVWSSCSKASRAGDAVWNMCLALVLILLVSAVCLVSVLANSRAAGALIGYAAGSSAVMAFLTYKR